MCMLALQNLSTSAVGQWDGEITGAQLRMTKLHGQVMKQLCVSHARSATSDYVSSFMSSK